MRGVLLFLKRKKMGIFGYLNIELLLKKNLYR